MKSVVNAAWLETRVAARFGRELLCFARASRSAGLKTATRALLAAIAALLALPACLPNNGTTVKSGSSGALTSLSETTTDDGAKAPCTRYDSSTASRAVCVSCYNSLLSSRCPGKSEFAKCVDPAVKNGYVTLINQCISTSTQAGFICTTTCSAGLVINPSTCTCVAPTTTPGSGSANVDVGQTDFGPPVVRATFPPLSIVGTPTPTIAPTECVGTLPLYFGVQNRGDTVFRLNSYSAPTVSASPNALGAAYLSNATTPRMMSTGETADHPGSNVIASLKFATGGESEILGVVGPPAFAAPTGTRVGSIVTVSGAGSDGSSFSDGVDTSVGAAGGLASDVSWSAPGFGARDKDGNLYFSDPLANVVDVICYKPGSGSGSPFCDGQDAGRVVRVAGQAGSAGHAGDAGASYLSTLNSPHGIAVDQSYNVYIADSGNHVIRKVTAGATIAASLITTPWGSVGSPANADNQFNFPYGLDWVGSGANQLFVADYQNHRVVQCNGTAAGCTTLIGNGTAGFQLDGAASTGAAWFNFPTDVKSNHFGNLIIADSRNHLIRGYCVNVAAADFCNAKTATHVTTIAGLPPVSGAPPTPAPAGTPRAGDSGDGTAANASLITYPTQILIAKEASDELNTAAAAGRNLVFEDSNIVFTERLRGGSLLNGVPEPSAVKAGTGPISDVTSMSMGFAHTCFAKNDGSVSCVGNNSVNQIGTASAANPQATPITVTTLASGRLAGGTYHTCVYAAGTGNARCWGYNADGQLGNNTQVAQTTPVPVATGTAGPANATWRKFVGGDAHTCAIDSTGGRAWCWGNASFGQLGAGNSTAHNAPNSADRVDTSTGAVNGAFDATYFDTNGRIASGANFVCISNVAVGDGEVYCWGDNSSNQLGYAATNTTRPSSVVAGLGGGTAWRIAAGGNHACAWIAGGAFRCWGSNSRGELGIGSISDSEQTATAVSGFTVSASASDDVVAVGLAHSCAIASDGRIYCWGDNTAGQLGNDDVPMSTVPIAVVGLPSGTPTAVYASGNQTCALIGAVPYCWGNNEYRQLGASTTASNPSGNVVRVICGNNAGMPGEGVCSGVPAPSGTSTGTIYTIAGQSGRAGNRGTGDGGNARSSTFAKVLGLAYDLYKNVLVSSGGFVDANRTDHIDFSLRRISNAVVGRTSGVKYVATDSNGLSSYWCLRLKPLTSCNSAGSCSCAMVAPTDEVDPEFWKAITSSATCQ